MRSQEQDRDRLTQALGLAEGAFGVTEPNPRVGCVIGGEDGTVFGTGATQRVGGPHAEVMALRQAMSAGHQLQGATAWVTLEPCAHHGRTPPCCEALVAAGLGRVVVALEDPFAQVAGTGIAHLRAAGNRVDFAEPALARLAWEINVGFFSRVQRGRPWLRVKAASSLDGRTGLDNGISQWITGDAARVDGHAWRRRAGAVVTGIGTVLADDPRLDVRLVPSVLQPLRVILDSSLRTPPAARVLRPPGQVLIVTAVAPGQRSMALENLGTEVLHLPGPGGRVDLHGLMNELGRRGVNEAHVEAGSGLTTSALQSGLADELLLYLAPRLLGGSRGVVAWAPLQRLQDGLDLEILDVAPVGADLRLRLRPAGAAAGSFGASNRTSGAFTSTTTPI